MGKEDSAFNEKWILNTTIISVLGRDIWGLRLPYLA